MGRKRKMQASKSFTKLSRSTQRKILQASVKYSSSDTDDEKISFSSSVISYIFYNNFKF